MSEFALTGEELEFIAAHQLVHAGLWGHAENYFSLFKKKGLLTSFDFSDQLAHKLIQSLLPYVDYPFFSYKENDAFIRQFLKSAVGKGSKIAVATLGEKGSLAYDGRDFYEYGVVDTMGAGDSFIAGFTYGILKGLSIESCLELGAKTAAKTIGYFGAW